MITKNTETTYSTICFSLINILFLAQHYSTYGCLCAFLSIAYYFYRVNYLENKNNGMTKMGISKWLGTYLGVFALDAIAILGFETKVFETKLFFENNISAVSGIVVLLIIEIIILSIINKRATANGNKFFYIRYIILAVATVSISSIYVNWEKFAIFSFVVIIILIALLIDSINKKNELRASSTGFAWARVILIVFNILSFLYGDFAVLLVDKIYNFQKYDFSPWYINVIACLLFVICAIRAQLLIETKQSSSNDVRIYISLIASVVMLWVLKSASTKYDMIFVLIMVVVNLVFLFQSHNDRTLDILDFEVSEITLKYVGMLVIAILLPVSLYNGWIFQFVCLSVAVIGIYAFYSTYIARKSAELEAPHKTWMFWQFILTMMAVYACVTAYFKSNFVGNYLVIGAIYLITTFAFGIINYENKLNHINHSTMRIVIAVSAMAFFIFSSNQSNVSIQFNVDNQISEAEDVSAEVVGETGKIKIEVRTKDNRKLKAYCYWVGSTETIVELPLEESKVNYIDMNNGCLKVVCEDGNGILSTSSHWFTQKELIEVKPVGTSKISLLAPENVEGITTPEGVGEPTGEPAEQAVPVQ